MKILIAEDDPVSSRLLQKALKKRGHEILCAEDGLKAWDLLKGGKYSDGYHRLSKVSTILIYLALLLLWKPFIVLLKQLEQNVQSGNKFSLFAYVKICEKAISLAKGKSIG